MLKGTVKWFSTKKGYGFIAKEDGEDVFVHASSIKGNGFRALYKGDKVSFDIVNDRKGPRAVGVLVEDNSSRNRREREKNKDRKNGSKDKYEWRNIKNRNNGNSKSVFENSGEA